MLINRILGLAVRGEYTTITTYTNLLQTAVNLGLCFAYAPMMKKYGKEVAKHNISLLIWLQALLYAAVFACIGVVCRQYDVSAMLVLGWLQIINNQVVFLALIDDIRFRNKVLLLSAFIYAIVNIGQMILGFRELHLVIVILCGKTLLEAVICSLHSRLLILDRKLFDRNAMMDTLKYGVPTALLATLILLNYNVDVYVLNYFHASSVQVGIYGVAYSLANMLWFIPDAFKELVYNKSARGNAARETVVLVMVNMCICAVICVGFAVFGEAFLGIMYGDEYRVAFPTVMTVFIGILPMVAFKLIHPIYVNEGKSLIVVGLLSVSVVANIVMACFLVPLYAAFGAALATVGSYTVCGLLFSMKFLKDYHLKIRTGFSDCLELIHRYAKR
ncbi:MATE family efflux transporter [Bifidobacterium platyrrhinorum]|uniref:Oligosaccharide flippase family protein n=1 Tax=Bifidobacterium platyrrhinorum TaxID=2661628 RepID=A0A6L9STP0_9BIFI|nr:hypothetical protein [Bifidobacterium platyrrhinorum]NEG55143.1 hypothetical protein [Bifidobacterium platyrrhinorum]